MKIDFTQFFFTFQNSWLTILVVNVEMSIEKGNGMISGININYIHNLYHTVEFYGEKKCVITTILITIKVVGLFVTNISGIYRNYSVNLIHELQLRFLSKLYSDTKR